MLSYISNVNKEKEADTENHSTEKAFLNYCMLILTLDAVGSNPKSVSREFYKELESYSNVRLSFYEKLWFELGKLLGL